MSDRATPEAAAKAYDTEAEATGWLGPEVAFGMVYQYVLPGQSILDLGIGSGLSSALFRKAGLRVYGMDVAEDMLDVCRWKGFDDLTQHDLLKPPYPYPPGSFDHVICMGVLPFLGDLSPVLAEAARLLKLGGTFVFMTLDRPDHEDFEFVVGPKYTKTDESMTMYRHSSGQIRSWLGEFGFSLLRSLPFTIYMDAARTESQQAVCYVAITSR